MKLLIAEDDRDIALFYKVVLEARNHHVVSTDNGEDCLTIYRQEFGNFASRIGSTPSDNRQQQQQAFDTVILDYKMPKINGIEVAKEIIKINPKQRIIISSAHSREFLFHSKKEIEKPVEFVQKPFDLQTFIETLENQLSYPGLQKLNQDEVITQALDHSERLNQVNTLNNQVSRTIKETDNETATEGSSSALQPESTINLSIIYYPCQLDRDEILSGISTLS